MESIKKILILAPHTDDGEFGCGASVAKFILSLIKNMKGKNPNTYKLEYLFTIFLVVNLIINMTIEFYDLYGIFISPLRFVIFSIQLSFLLSLKKKYFIDAL